MNPTLRRLLLVVNWALMIALLLSTAIFYAEHKFRPSMERFLGVLSLAIISVMLIDLTLAALRANRTASLTDSSRVAMSLNIVYVVAVVAVVLLAPTYHLPWALVLAYVFFPWTFDRLGGQVLTMDTKALRELLTAGAICGALTWGQLLLAQHYKTWLFMKIGVFPVPLLAITVFLTTAVAVVSALLALIYMISRVMRRAT